MQTKKTHKAEIKLMKALIEFMIDEVKIADISVSDLCERAGVSRTAFYAYYNNVSNVQVAMEERVAERTISNCARLFTESLPEQEIAQLVEKNNAYISENKKRILALLNPKLGSGFEERMILKIMDVLHPRFAAASFSEVRERVSAYAFVEYGKYLIKTDTYATTNYVATITDYFDKVRAFNAEEHK